MRLAPLLRHFIDVSALIVKNVTSSLEPVAFHPNRHCKVASSREPAFNVLFHSFHETSPPNSRRPDSRFSCAIRVQHQPSRCSNNMYFVKRVSEHPNGCYHSNKSSLPWRSSEAAGWTALNRTKFVEARNPGTRPNDYVIDSQANNLPRHVNVVATVCVAARSSLAETPQHAAARLAGHIPNHDPELVLLDFDPSV